MYRSISHNEICSETYRPEIGKRIEYNLISSCHNEGYHRNNLVCRNVDDCAQNGVTGAIMNITGNTIKVDVLVE